MKSVIYCVAFLIGIVPAFANADVLSVDEALNLTQNACSGIEDNLDDLKKMAGINTAVTGVGTGLGAGATIVGIKKAKIDKELNAVRLDKLRAAIEAKGEQQEPIQSESSINAFENQMRSYIPYDLEEEEDGTETVKPVDPEQEKLEKQSKKLGNWRTGLLGGTTATGVAGAIIAGNNKTDQSLRDQIEQCINAIAALKKAYTAAKMADDATFNAKEVIKACEQYKYIDLAKIDKRATGAMASSIVTAAAGATGTTVSALANSDKVRKDDTEAGQKKEKNLNTAANVLAGGTTVASAVATIFNASQISAIKQVLKVAEECSATF